MDAVDVFPEIAGVPGEMAERIRRTDWAATSLGPVSTWPDCLRTSVGICISSRFPMFVWWGPDLVNLYNDAYAPVLGKRHPIALGRPAKSIWSEIWDIVGPQAEAVLQRGESTWNERVHLAMQRSGYEEDTYFTWSYSPIRDHDGKIAGLFCACTEETHHVRAEAERDRFETALRESEDHFRHSVELNPSIPWTADASGAILDFSQKWLDITGMTREQAMEAGWVNVMHHDELEMVKEVYTRAITTGEPYDLEHRLRHPDGSYRWMRARAFPRRDVTGKIIRWYGTVEDIHRRKTIEEALIRSTERLELAQRAARIGVYDWNVQTGQVVWTEQEERLFGLEPGTFNGHISGWANSVHPEDRESANQMLRDAMAAHENEIDFAFRIVRPDGEVRWIEGRGRFFYDAAGQPLRMVGVNIDTTDRRRSEAEIKEARQRYRAVFEATRDAMIIYTPQGTIVEANPAACRTYGYSYEQLIGVHAPDAIHPDARPMFEEFLKTTSAGGDFHGETVDRRADGTSFPIEVVGNRLEYNSSPHLMAVVRDITERKRALDRLSRLHAVSAALSEALTTADVSRVAVEQGISALGATAGSLTLLSEDGLWLEMAGSMGYPTEVMEPWQRFPLTAPVPITDAVRTGEPVYLASIEDRIGRYPALKNVTARKETVASACIPLKIGSAAVGVLALSFDHAMEFSVEDQEFMLSLARQCAQSLERARLFEAEQVARANAEQASRVKDEFLATLSHELRTPLNAILGWSQIIRRGPGLSDDLAQGLEVIERNARAQSQIIEELLDMSRIISGKVRLDLQKMELAEVVRLAVETARPTADAKSVRLQAVIDPPASANMSGDPNRLQQVLWNLIANAIKFTPRHGRVQVTLQRVNSHLEVAVTDTGEGIDPEFIPFVFDRFRQANATITRRHGGLGLGLSIAKQLVELHGGSIRASSDGIGQGSTFTVSLPLSVLQQEPDRVVDGRPRRATPAPPPAVEARSLAGLRVLVVDDDADARSLVKRLLEESRAEVTTASTVEEAMQRLQNQPPDVLVSDIGMPNEDGYTLIRKVRALNSDVSKVPAVALTAYARAEDRIKAIRAGYQMHVVKPVEPIELLTVVASLAGRNSA